MLVTNSDYEGDLGGPVLVPDPDPGPDATAPAPEADTVGVPAGSDRPSGESDFADGTETRRDSTDADDALETPIVPGGAAGLDSDEATTED
jgi:hypothetical protein